MEEYLPLILAVVAGLISLTQKKKNPNAGKKHIPQTHSQSESDVSEEYAVKEEPTLDSPWVITKSIEEELYGEVSKIEIEGETPPPVSIQYVSIEMPQSGADDCDEISNHHHEAPVHNHTSSQSKKIKAHFDPKMAFVYSQLMAPKYKEY